MHSTLKLYLNSCLVLLLAVSSCKKKSDTQPDATDSQRSVILTNIGNNIIIPNYQLLNTAVNKLDSAVTAFNSSPDNTSLLNLQNIFKDAYQKWQLCSPFGFGPADQQNLNVNMNTFPADTTRINSNINSNPGTNLAAIANLAAKGFPGLDYLLFGTGSDNNSILLKYTTDSKAANRKQYLAALSADIKTEINTVLNAWLPQGGNYINTFINASGTDVGSSLSQLINEVDFDFEILKNNKIGIPDGKQSMGILHPEEVEAYYSGISSRLALIQLQTIENTYLGKSDSQGDGPGLDDYLVQLDAQYNGGSLNDAIKNQFSSAYNKLQPLPDPLSATVQNNTSSVDAAYTELQKLTVLLKSDMPSAMGILITYGDTDGD